jgi:hypothetical protein
MAMREETPKEATWNPRGAESVTPRTRLPKWRQESGRGWRRRSFLRIASVALLYLLFSGLLIWVVLWLSPPQPARLVLIGAGYEPNLAIPENVFGREWLKDLEELTRGSPTSLFWRSRRLILGHSPRTLRTQGAWDKDLDSFPEKTVVLCLALHGGSDSKGAYLLADDADARDVGRNRLRLGDVLDRLAAKSLEAKNKLLILDATRLTAHWPIGMLHNDFAKELERVNDRIASIPRLVVISASDVDQRSWESNQWRRTAFAHFIVDGLKGGAALPNGRIDARGLFEYVRAQVTLWSQVARGAVQTPVLFPRVGGMERAADMELAVVPRRTTPAPAALNRPEASADLLAAWREYDRLKLQDTPPASYAPHTWMLYQATVLRLEELERAGDRAAANLLLSRLAELNHELQESRTIPLARSRANSLAMPAAEGERLPSPPDAVEQQFNLLWAAPSEEFPKRWVQLQQSLAATTMPTRTTVRLQVIRKALDRVMESPEQDMNRAVALLRVLDAPSEPRPAEAHDLLMLNRPDDVPSGRNDTYFQGVSKAIRARLFAENAALGVGQAGHPYCERVAPWVHSTVRNADENRRLGQDLLFAPGEPNWKEACRLLDAAYEQYQTALEEASSVRRALVLRDQILPALPFYTQWVATNRPLDQRLRQQVESLWDDVHTLTSQITPPEPGKIQSTPSGFQARLEQVRDGFSRLQREFARACEEMLGSEEPSTFLAIQEALRIPFLDLPEPAKQGYSRLTQIDISQAVNYPRVKLLSHMGRIEERLHATHVDLMSGGNGNRDSNTAATAAEIRARATQVARCGSRLAVATIGRSWYTEGLNPDAESFDQVSERTGTFDLDQDRSWLARLGDHVGNRWVGRVDEIVRLVERPRVRSSNQDNIAKLRKADGMSHLLDAAAADLLERHLLPRHHPRALTASISRSQLSVYRRLLIRSLLVNQARRAFDDHWFSEGSQDSQPYYRSVALAYLDDALKLDPLQFTSETPITELERDVKRTPDGLRIEGPNQRVVTDESTLDLRCSLRSEGTRRRGYPVLWTQADAPFRVVAPADSGRMRTTVGDETEPKLDYRLENRPADAGDQAGSLRRGESRFLIHGLFRGQRFDHTTRIDLYPRPEQVASRHPLSGLPRVAVRAGDGVFDKYGSGIGIVAFLLDASGSMGPPRNEPFTDGTRYELACRALEQVLKELPAGTIVGLYVFGAAPSDRKDVPAEQTIQTVQPPTRWDPSMTDALMQRIRYPSVVPWSESPIIRTILAARDDLLSINSPGFKSIVVVTDGDDNRWAEDKIKNPQGKDVPTALKEAFHDTEIQLNVVGFRPASTAETDRMNSQYRAVSQLPVPGRFYYVDDAVEIVSNIRAALRRELSFRIVGEDEQPIPAISARQVLISRPQANIRWFPTPLQPGGYKLMGQADQRLLSRPASLALNFGDLLLVNLVAGEGRLGFERGLYATEFYPFSPSAFDSRNRWRLTVLQNQKTSTGALEILLAMERQPDPKETTLRLIRPRDIWFEMATGPETADLVPIRWTEREGYPVPTWTIEAPDWPGKADAGIPLRPMLRASWFDDSEAPPVRILRSSEDFELDSRIDSHRPIAVGADSVTIESVGVEEQAVQVDDQRKEKKPCLVVRLSYRDKPIRVRPAGVSFVGAEHRCYLAAKRYTGIFWTKTRDEVLNAIRQLRLELIGRDDFQAACRRNGTTIELLLEGPRAEETLPLPIGPSPAQLSH